MSYYIYTINNITYKFEKNKDDNISYDIYKIHWEVLKNKPLNSYNFIQYLFYVRYYIDKKYNKYNNKVSQMLL